METTTPDFSLAKLARRVVEHKDVDDVGDVSSVLDSLIPKDGLRDGCVRNEDTFIVHLAGNQGSISFFLGSDARLRCYGAGASTNIDLNNPDSPAEVWKIINGFYTYNQHPMLDKT